MNFSNFRGVSKLNQASRSALAKKARRRGLRLFASDFQVESLEHRTLMTAGLAESLAGAAQVGSMPAADASSSASSMTTLDKLEPLARYAISASMGAELADYAATQTQDGFTLDHGYTVGLNATGATFSTGTDSWQFVPESFGYGADQAAIGSSALSASKNRVTYDTANLDTWFVNGPSGVQQGFTIDHRPSQGNASEPLVVSVGLGGSLSATVDADGRGLSLARPDGTAVLNYGGLVAFDATGKTFDARMELVPGGTGQDLHFVVNDTGAVYPLTIDPITTITESAKLSSIEAGYSAYYGYSVAVSEDGTTIAVGAPLFDLGSISGAVFVYVKPATGWSTTSSYNAKLSLPSSESSSKSIGGSLSISADGSTLLIGNSISNGVDYAGGYAYIYTRPVGGWVTTTTYAASLQPFPLSLTLSRFGRSVSLSSDGNTAIIGAPNEALSDSSNRLGTAYIFTKGPSGWSSFNDSYTAKLVLPTTEPVSSNFGKSVSISSDGNTVLITASGTTKAAYIFTKPVSGWVSSTNYQAKISFWPSTTGQIHQANLSGDGTNAVISVDGSLRVFARPSNGIWASTLQETAVLSILGTPLVAASQSYDGSKIIAGAHTMGNGLVYVFEKPAAGWVNSSTAAFKAMAAEGSIQLGISVALTSNGKSFITGTLGKAYIFDLNSPATVISSPVNKGVAVGSTGTFTASGSGAPAPKAQWQKSTDSGANWTDIVGATSYTYTTPATVMGDDGTQYRAVFSNTYSGTTNKATTTPATMTVGYVPVVTSQPAPVVLNAGSTATFTTAASGTPTPSVQWYQSTDYLTASTPTWTAISGATSLSYTTAATVKADNDTFYKARFTNAIGTADTNPAQLTVLFAPEIATQPANMQATGGQAATFTATAKGGPTPTVQWQVSTDTGGTWTDISGATSTTYSFTAMGPDNGKQFRAVFTNTQGSATSNAATLVVKPGFLSPSSTSFLPGMNGSFEVSFTSAGDATLSTNYNYWASTFGSLPAGWKTGGQATVSSNTLILNPATNSTQGTLVMPAIGAASPSAFTTKFQYKTSNNGGADGTSFNYGLIPANPSGNEMGILQSNTGIVLSIIEYNTDRIEAYYNGTQLASVRFDLGGGSYRDFTLTVTAANQLLVNVGGQTIMSVALPDSYATVDKTAWQYGFGARSGGLNSEHSIKNLSISTPNTLPPGVTFNPTTKIISGTPGIGSVGDYVFDLVATDSIGSTIQPFTLSIPASTALTGQMYLSSVGIDNSTGQQVINDTAFVALKPDGSITAWGNSSNGGTLPASLTGANAANNVGFVRVTSSRAAFAALKGNGSIVSWGDAVTIANSPTDTGFTAISSTASAFAALKADGSITAWGDPIKGGTLPNSLTGSNASNNFGFVKIFSNNYAFAAIKDDGTIVSWGLSGAGGANSGNSMAPANTLSNKFVTIYATSQRGAAVGSFAAIRADGSIAVWGDANTGGSGAPTGTGYVSITKTKDAYAALNANGTVAFWGGANTGGSNGPSGANATGYKAIYSTYAAFVGVRVDGSLWSWGYPTEGGSGAPSGTGFLEVAGTARAFAALNANGSISTWGDSNYGGTLPSTLTGAFAADNSNFVRIFSNGSGFVGLRTNGTTVTWGNSTVTSQAAPYLYNYVVSNNSAFAGFNSSYSSIYSWGDSGAGGGYGFSNYQTIATGLISEPYYSSSSTYPTGFVSGQATSLDFSAQGIGAYYSIISGSLPTGLTLNQNTGMISGTPAADYTGPASFTIQAASALGSTTKAVTLTVQYAPVITTQPTNSLVTAGGTATFTAAATANPGATVKWQEQVNSISQFIDIPGATSTTYTKANVTSSENGFKYRAVFTNSIGVTTTNEVEIVVLTAPAITYQPVHTTVADSATCVLSVTATGSPAPSYQWQSSTDGGTGWANISGATASLYSFTADIINSPLYYRVIATNPAGSVTSSAAEVTIVIAPVITTQPSDLTIGEGATAAFTAAATGTPTPTVQWQASDNGVNTWTDIAGATSATYSFNATLLDTGKWYRALFTNVAGPASTVPAMLSVTAPPTAPVMQTQPQNQLSQPGNTNTFNAIAVGSPAPSVQWQQSTDGTNWTNTTGGSGATTTIFTTPVLSQGDNGLSYRAMFTNTSGSVSSDPVTLSITTPPSVTQQPTSQTGNQGGTATFTAAGSGNPAPGVKWQESIDSGTNWIDIAGANATTYTTAALVGADNGKLVRAIFTNGNGSDAVSNSATLTVNYVSTQPVSQSFAAGQAATFSAAVTSSSATTVQWQLSTNSGTSWAEISGATATSYTTPTLGAGDNGNQYRAVFTNSLGAMTSSVAQVTVQFAPSITIQPANTGVLPGSTASFYADATGNPTPTVKWQVSTNSGSSWADIAGATSVTYSFSATLGDNGKQYRAIFTNGIGSDATTNAATLTVGSVPVITTANRMTLAVGLTGGMSVIATGNPAPQYSIVSGTLPSGVTLDATTGLFSGTPASGAAGTYPVTIQASNGVGTAPTQAFTLNVIATITSFAISKGQSQRSYIRYIDIGFDSAASALAIKNNPSRLSLTKADLNGVGATPLSLSPTWLSTSGSTLGIDFGAIGLGNSRNTATADGYYTLSVDMDGTGTNTTNLYFFRLFGDINGDRQVTTADQNVVLAGCTQAYNVNLDLNGDGSVNASDYQYVKKSVGRRLKSGLIVTA